MAVILLSYFSTMVTVLAVLMALLNGVLGASAFHQAHAQSHLRVARSVAHRNEVAAAKPQQVAQIPPAINEELAGFLARSESANGRETQLAAQQPAPQPVLEQKAKPVRVARDQNGKDRVAPLGADPGYASALGYAPEPRERLAAARIFGTIGQLR